MGSKNWAKKIHRFRRPSHEQYNEKVSIKRVRQLRNKILNEARQIRCSYLDFKHDKAHLSYQADAIT